MCLAYLRWAACFDTPSIAPISDHDRWGALESGDVVATFDFGGAMPVDHFDPHIALAVTIDELDANGARGRAVVDVRGGLRRGVATEINLRIVPLLNETLLDWD